MTPEDFAAREEMDEQEGWTSREKKAKKKASRTPIQTPRTTKLQVFHGSFTYSLRILLQKKKGGREDDVVHRSASAEALDKQPQSELLAGEIERQRNASVSRNFGQKMLFNALGARESSMVYNTHSLVSTVEPLSL